MAHMGDPAKADSQLYVTLANRPDLDGQYAVFGQVITGEDVPDALQVGDVISRVLRETVAAMADHPDPRWDRLAAREPYFAVLTAPQFLRRNLTPERHREFFASGDALVESMFRAIELQLSPYFNPTAILEYGCGVGRLAIPLARRAVRNGGSVTAVDRSAGDARRRPAGGRPAGRDQYCVQHAR